MYPLLFVNDKQKSMAVHRKKVDGVVSKINQPFSGKSLLIS